jgi:UDP-N-acetylmuramoyl-L-alanyl-D-glutamate--2,6-diaminopimelate ligase
LALQARLAELRDRGCTHVAMEVSSHALAQYRVDGTRFTVAVFTYLGHDHLDFHGSVDAYFDAKARLFGPDLSDAAVVNADDPAGRRLIDSARVPTVAYSTGDVDDLVVGPRESTGRWRGHALRVPMGGRHNVANALAALTAAELLGVDPAVAAEGVAATPPVRGRLEAVDAGQPFTVLVDFAHTADGLEQALLAARSGARRVIVVFGAGGDKDMAKRPRMGEVAARLADLVLVTSDNPRSEDPGVIVAAIVAGARGAAHVRAIVDRREAIAAAFAAARPGDVVLLAGKGHETTMESAGVVTPFDDRAVALELLGATE